MANRPDLQSCAEARRAADRQLTLWPAQVVGWWRRSSRRLAEWWCAGSHVRGTTFASTFSPALSRDQLASSRPRSFSCKCRAAGCFPNSKCRCATLERDDTVSRSVLASQSASLEAANAQLAAAAVQTPQELARAREALARAPAQLLSDAAVCAQPYHNCVSPRTGPPAHRAQDPVQPL